MLSASAPRSLMLSAERMDEPVVDATSSADVQAQAKAPELALQRLLDVEVAYAEPEQQWVVPLSLAEGATVADALAAVAELEPFARLSLGLPLNQMAVGVYGEVVAHSQVLQAFDRVELYRPLHQDPKAARRMRAKQTPAAS